MLVNDKTFASENFQGQAFEWPSIFLALSSSLTMTLCPVLVLSVSALSVL